MSDKHFMRGFWWDVIKSLEGEVVTPVRENVGVISMATFLATFFVNETLYLGNLWHAIGSGDAGWDTDPTNAEITDTSLENEVYRQATTPVFCDTSYNQSSTNIGMIKVTTTFGTDVLASGSYIREHSLFTGESEDSGTDEGFMLDAIRHARIWKDNTVQLTRVIVLDFLGAARPLVTL